MKSPKPKSDPIEPYKLGKTTTRVLAKWLASRRIEMFIQESKNNSKERAEAAENRSNTGNYWDDENYKSIKVYENISEKVIASIVLIQNCVRLWLAIKIHLRQKKAVVKGTTSLQIVQASMKRYLYQQNHLKKMKEINKEDKEFSKFIEKLKEKKTKDEKPFMLYMYSRQKGSKELRKIFIDDKTHSFLCWKVNALVTKKMELRKIYKIVKGQSGAFYTANPTNKSLCFHILVVGDIKIDFEFEDFDGAILQFKFFFDGFERLLKLFNGPSSFYIDILGIPRRAGASVVEYAVTNKPKQGFRSEADENRYRTALGNLRTEYQNWELLYKNELKEYKKERLERLRNSDASPDKNNEQDDKDESLSSGTDEEEEEEEVQEKEKEREKEKEPGESIVETDKKKKSWFKSLFSKSKPTIGNSFKSNLLEDENDESNHNNNEQNDENLDENSDDISIQEVEIKGESYLVTSKVHGKIYKKQGDEEIGDQVGVFENGKAVFFSNETNLTHSNGDENNLFSEVWNNIYTFMTGDSNAAKDPTPLDNTVNSANQPPPDNIAYQASEISSNKDKAEVNEDKNKTSSPAETKTEKKIGSWFNKLFSKSKSPDKNISTDVNTKPSENLEHESQNSDDISIQEVEIKGESYLVTSKVHGKIYKKQGDEEIGDQVGVFENGKAVFFS